MAYRIETNMRRYTVRVPSTVSAAQAWGIAQDKLRSHGERGEYLVSVREAKQRR